MRKKLAAARRLPFESCTEVGGIDGDQHQIALTGEMLSGRPGKLRRSREMNETVAPVGVRSAIDPAVLGFTPRRAFADFINDRHVMRLISGLDGEQDDPNGP